MTIPSTTVLARALLGAVTSIIVGGGMWAGSVDARLTQVEQVTASTAAISTDDHDTLIKVSTTQGHIIKQLDTIEQLLRNHDGSPVAHAETK